MSAKSIKYLLPATALDMGGFPVKQPLPTRRVQQLDPFLLLHHARAKFSNKRPARQQGVGPHPHRGFSPVTFVVDGEIHHRDSRGNDQIATKGEVQWMHAGMGIVHSERPSQQLVDRNGYQEIIQLWINTPAATKMVQPSYQHLFNDVIPIFNSKDEKVNSKLVVGAYQDLQGKIEAQSDLLILWSTARTGGTEVFHVPPAFNSMLYLIKGEVSVSGYGKIEAEHLAIFETRDTQIELTAGSDAEFLLCCGRPLNEKVTQYGPYVMNTQTEIMEAMRDYQMGKMGILIEA